MTNHASHIHRSCMGYCAECKEVHSLPSASAEAHAQRIMEEFQTIRRLDYLASDAAADPMLSIDHLFPGERGHMFGLLECMNDQGERIVLRAFSSLRGGIRHIDGWVPSIHRDEVWNELVLPTQARIKELTRIISQLEAGSDDYHTAVATRREISSDLVEKLQAQMTLTNFKGQQRPMTDAFQGPHGIPGGVGDCCGPKLLNHAALNELQPLSLAEFYWGSPTPSGSKRPGQFYSCCVEKCQPILGFMLCGIDEPHT